MGGVFEDKRFLMREAYKARLTAQCFLAATTHRNPQHAGGQLLWCDGLEDVHSSAIYDLQNQPAIPSALSTHAKIEAYLAASTPPLNYNSPNLGLQSMEHATEATEFSSRLFALIIGINDYTWPPFRNLGGAVNDASAMKEYLIGTLHASKDRILTLYDDQATREAIICALRNLQNDPRIDRGDPIVIFYAGHGGELTAPVSWLPHEKIQCLVPQDYEPDGAEPFPGREPIPDRTIGALIEDIAEAKGNNITVVFDCCHSGSGTRGQDKTYISRSVLLDKLNIPETLDENIWKSRVGMLASGFAYHGAPRSHVLLAACGEKELAYEHQGRGQFTLALLTMLKDCAANGELASITYAKLLDRLRLKYPRAQHPRCEGLNQHRLLFNGADREAYYPISRNGEGYVISAGSAHGVSLGVEFTLYDDKKAFGLGVVLVDEEFLIEDFKTILPASVPLGGAPFARFARLNRVGKLPLYVDPENLSSVLETLRHIDAYGTDSQIFRLVDASEAKLEVAPEADSVVFKVLDRRVKHFGLTRLPHHATHEKISSILSSAARYFWFLGLASKRDQISTVQGVAVDFYRLHIDYDDRGDPILSQRDPGLCRKDPGLDNSEVINFVVEPDAFYGIKVTNDTPMDLYLNVFLFNNSSLSIIPCYVQSTAGKPGPSLKRGRAFTIGYGTKTNPLPFSLEEDQHVDVGYLKIFFSTQPLDLSDVAQPSPFSDVNAREGIDDKTLKRDDWRMLKIIFKFISPGVKTDTWFTLEIPVVQRRE